MLRNLVLLLTIQHSTGSGKPEQLFLSGTTSIKGRRLRSLSLQLPAWWRSVLSSTFQVGFEF